MKRQYHLTTLVVASLLAAACNHEGNVSLSNLNDTLSWALGENVAITLQQGNVFDVNEEVFLQAVKHTLDGKQQPLSDDFYQQAMQYIYVQSQFKQMQETDSRKTDVQSAQEEYFKRLLQDNPSVKKHPSGFYYEVLREGKGPHAQYAHAVRFDYRSYKMLTGELFDQTYGQRPPIDHVVGSPMFQGLIEGLCLMNAGSMYRFYFPYQLAFGESGSGDIPGFTPFIYEVELHQLLD